MAQGTTRTQGKKWSDSVTYKKRNTMNFTALCLSNKFWFLSEN